MKTSTKALPFLLIAIALAFAGFYYLGQDDEIKAQYSTANITRGELVATVSTTGTLNPVISVQVGSQVSGVIHRLHADFNSNVKKGELIAEIEPSLFKTQVAQAKANLKNAQAALEKAKLSIRVTKRAVNRAKELFEQKMVTESELDTIRFNHDSALVERAIREASVAQANAALEQAQVNLAHTQIYAPIDGVVISRDVDVGQTVAASLQAPTLFKIARDLTRMQIETEVDEAFIGQIQAGQAVSFNVFAYPKKSFKGSVVQVRLNPTIEAGVVKYNCIINVSNDELLLKPGMTATAAIEVEHKSDIFKVPGEALRYIPAWPDEKLDKLRKELKRGEAFIWTLKDNQPVPIKVRRGLVGEKETEILSDELVENMQVIVPGSGNKDSAWRRRRISLF